MRTGTRNWSDVYGVVTRLSDSEVSGHDAFMLRLDGVLWPDEGETEGGNEAFTNRIGEEIAVHLRPDRLESPAVGDERRYRLRRLGPGLVVATDELVA